MPSREDRDRGYSSGRTAGGAAYNDSDIAPDGDFTPQTSDYDETASQIPIWSFLDGSQSRIGAAQAEAESRRNQAYWEGLGEWMPSADDLAVDYEQEGYVGGPESSELGGARADNRAIDAQMGALQQMQEWGRGGATDADRAMSDMFQRRQGQMARSDREAAMQQAQARGMGGSGLSFLSQQQAGEAAAGRQADFQAQQMQAIQQRALQAMQSAGALGSQARGQSFGEDSTRRSAIDDFNRWNTDYARGREGRNTDRRNQTRESRSNARQTAYGNRERAVAGATNQYSTDASRRANQGARDDASDASAAAVVGGVIEGLAS